MMNDLRFALRQLLKSPGFATVAVLTLALGIGATTAIFSLINGVLLEPLPYEQSGQLVSLFELREDKRPGDVSPGAFMDWREQSTCFEGLSAVREAAANLTGTEQPERIKGLSVSANFLSILRQQPEVGHGFLPPEERVGGGDKVVVLSHGLWQRRFGGDSNLLGVSLVPFLTRAESNEGATAGALIGQLEKEIPKLMEEAAVPGLSIAVIKDAKLFWRRGFGAKDTASKEPVNNDTMFEAASTSKPVFAYAVMKLCEKGIMDIDTPLTKYTSARFLGGDPRLDLITARHVLSHTSGFQNWRSKEKPLAIHFTPGEQWHYSGEGYSYLQSVVTHLTGKVNQNDCAKFEAGLEVCATDIETYMKANILVPFAMSSSGYLWDERMEKHMAWGHDEKGIRFEKRRRSSAPAVARCGMAGGLHTTPTDYAKFLVEIINAKPSDAFRLNKTSLQEMLRPRIKRNAQSSWALGWEINHTDSGDFIRHGGGNPGFDCLVAASVERKTGCVIMTNSQNGYYGVIAKLITGETLPQLLRGKLRAE
jgi:CubicO group peptidase (beta-lactamase class C family)